MDNSLSRFIEKDLTARILSGRNLPASLSLVDLSNHYKVSITPVREAVGNLVDQKLIERLPNRRLRINEAKIGSGTTDHEGDVPVILKDWGEILLDEIMFASLSMKPIYLRENFLAEKHQVGRSIIRQTFSGFAGAGLIEHVPRKGWLVYPLSHSDLKAYLEVREVLELRAFDLARERVVASDLARILERESHALNNSMHQLFVEMSGNRYIRAFFRQYLARYYTKLFYYAAPEISVVDEMTSEHQFILRAMLDRRWDSAREALSAHIRVQESVLMRLLDPSSRSVDS